MSHLEAALEALADHVEGDRIDAGVDGRHVDADVVQHQEEAKKRDGNHAHLFVLRSGSFPSRPPAPEQLAAVRVLLVVDGELQDAAEVERQPAQGEDQDQAEHRLSNLPPLEKPVKEHFLGGKIG